MTMPAFDRSAYNDALMDVMKEIIQLRAKMMDAEVVDARVQAAVLEEREACARLCDDLWQEDGTAYDCRTAIRARSNP